MEIEFATDRLAAASLRLSEASRVFGVPIGRKYIQRLAIIRAVDKFEQLYGHRALPLHASRGNRSGQFAITLTANYRLVIGKANEDAVRILGVEDHHGD